MHREGAHRRVTVCAADTDGIPMPMHLCACQYARQWKGATSGNSAASRMAHLLWLGGTRIGASIVDSASTRGDPPRTPTKTAAGTEPPRPFRPSSPWGVVCLVGAPAARTFPVELRVGDRDRRAREHRSWVALAVFSGGVVVPVIARGLDGPAMALRSLPLAILLVLIGGALWFRGSRTPPR